MLKPLLDLSRRFDPDKSFRTVGLVKERTVQHESVGLVRGDFNKEDKHAA